MQTKSIVVRVLVLVVISAVVIALPGRIHADGMKRPLTIQYTTTPDADPTIENLPDKRLVFKIASTGNATGDLKGTLKQRITQVVPTPEPELEPITVFFTLATDGGTLEGYFHGYYHQPPQANQAKIQAHGQVLSVTGKYADLYLADVFADDLVTLQNGQGTGDKGTLTIVPQLN